MSDWPARGALFLAAALAGLPLCRALPGLLRTAGLEKRNYRGEPIYSGGGLLFVVSALPWLFAADSASLPTAVAALGFGLLGYADDRWGTAEYKGLRGHLRALRTGRITTGFLKAAGGAAMAAAVAWWLRPVPEALLAAPLIALTANLLNLLDLRPLRTLKGFWFLALPLAWTGPLLPVQFLGLSLPYLRLEAQRRVMLGDTGANALGAVVGVSLVLALPWWGLAGALGVLVLFHGWAERHSLTAWIEARAWARTIDRWGWAADPDPADGPG